MRKKLLLPIMLFCIPALLFSQAKLVENVTKKGNEIVIPYKEVAKHSLFFYADLSK